MTLIDPVDLRSVTLRNRTGLAPMTQYCAEAGFPTPWHESHYSTRALGVGLVIVEATSISESGAVTPHDLRLADDAYIPAFARVAAGILAQGATPGIQLSHGGRKSSRSRPWDGDLAIPVNSGGWEIFGPSAVPFATGYATPTALTAEQIGAVIKDFAAAAGRAAAAGFQLLELHAGHGRLLHSFLSPLSNRRTDEWGGSFENRCRLLLDVVLGIRQVWPSELPLAVRLSCVDWVHGGWTLDDSVELAHLLLAAGVDLIDCTSGGIQRPIEVQVSPGYQVKFATEIRRRAGIATAAVGMIDSYQAAERVVEEGHADLVLMGRRLLLDPTYILRHAARAEYDYSLVPPQYQRALRSVAAADNVPEL